MKIILPNNPFSAKNPEDNKTYGFNLSNAGWLSRNGVFHFNYKMPRYAKLKVIEFYLNKMPIVKNWII